jgi:hypothetical protein
MLFSRSIAAWQSCLSNASIFVYSERCSLHDSQRVIEATPGIRRSNPWCSAACLSDLLCACPTTTHSEFRPPNAWFRPSYNNVLICQTHELHQCKYTALTFHINAMKTKIPRSIQCSENMSSFIAIVLVDVNIIAIYELWKSSGSYIYIKLRNCLNKI